MGVIVKKAVLFIIMLCVSLPVYAADSSVLNGYWQGKVYNATKLIRYPYIWDFGGSEFSPSIGLSKMRLIQSHGNVFTFLYELQSFAVENTRYSNITAPDNKDFEEHYELIRLSWIKEDNGIRKAEFFTEESCEDKSLNKRHDLMDLNDIDLSKIIEKSECHEKSDEWIGPIGSYDRIQCKNMTQLPWFFPMIAPEYLPCRFDVDDEKRHKDRQ